MDALQTPGILGFFGSSFAIQELIKVFLSFPQGVGVKERFVLLFKGQLYHF